MFPGQLWLNPGRRIRCGIVGLISFIEIRVIKRHHEIFTLSQKEPPTIQEVKI